MTKTSDGIFEAHFNEQKMCYFSRLYKFDEQTEFMIQPNQKSLLYVID